MSRTILLSALAAVLIAGAHAQGKGKGHNKPSEAALPGSAQAFGPSDRDMISGYYRNPGNLPPGLAKRNGELPPGLEKQLRRKGHLPPGLEKRFSPFPANIESRLPPCPLEVRRGLIGGTAVMWDSRTGVILDAFVAVRL